MQPTHFTVVDEEKMRMNLLKACLGQKQIAEAPALVILSGDMDVYKNHWDQVVKMDLQAEAIDADYAKIMDKFVKLGFEKGPLSLMKAAKSLVVPAVRLMKPTPRVPVLNSEMWTMKQVMLSAMNFMLAASAAGLSSGPMEGFDDKRVKKILGIPANHCVPLIITLGYSSEAPKAKTRLPLSSIVHYNQWQRSK
jgi:nitroreductase